MTSIQVLSSPTHRQVEKDKKIFDNDVIITSNNEYFLQIMSSVRGSFQITMDAGAHWYKLTPPVTANEVEIFRLFLLNGMKFNIRFNKNAHMHRIDLIKMD